MSIQQIKSGVIADGAITATDLSSTLDLTGKTVTLPAGVGGKVLQVLQATRTGTTSTTTSGSFTDIAGMSVSITPSSASNKVLVMFSINTSNATGDQNDCIQLVRDSTNIASGTGGSSVNCTLFVRENSSASVQPSSMTFLDSPSTTSSVTYKLQWRPQSGGTLYLNRRGAAAEFGTISTITVMEIAA